MCCIIVVVFFFLQKSQLEIDETYISVYKPQIGVSG